MFSDNLGESICGAGVRHSRKLLEELIAANNLLHSAMAVTIGKKSVLAIPLSQFCIAMPGKRGGEQTG